MPLPVKTLNRPTLTRGSEWGLVLFAHIFWYLLLNWPIYFLMFTDPEKNTVTCLEGSLNIFGNSRTSSLVFGNLWQRSGNFDSLRKSSEINCCKMASLRSMAVLSGALLSGEAEKARLKRPRTSGALTRLYYFVRPTQTAMLRRL